jgi:multisubunit Na+/H+ antiporter MnhC subunit
MAPSTAPHIHWIHLNMEGDHLEVNTTISHVLNGMAPFNFDEKTKTESVGPLPGFFLVACVVGLAVTAMVTLRQKRAAARSEQNERLPLVTSAAASLLALGAEPKGDSAYDYQEAL